jgi:c-di-GMP-binding flagellar brake protein YcgR
MGMDLSSGKIVNTYIRRYKRSPYSAKAVVSFNGIGFTGTCSSISMGGCFIDLRKKPDLERGNIVLLNIVPDMVKIKVNCSARVCTVYDQGIAVEFLNLDPNIKRHINEFVSSFIEKNSSLDKK